jgi:hypothetical protein
MRAGKLEGLEELEWASGLPEQGDVEASMVTSVAKHMRTGKLEGLEELRWGCPWSPGWPDAEVHTELDSTNP